MSTIGSNIAALKSLHNLRLNEEGVLIDTIRLRTQNIPLNQIKSITKNGKT